MTEALVEKIARLLHDTFRETWIRLVGTQTREYAEVVLADTLDHWRRQGRIVEVSALTLPAGEVPDKRCRLPACRQAARDARRVRQ